MKPEQACPVPESHGRLHQAHRLWHQTQAAYPDPEGFTANLNATIQLLRSVTFVLQKEHASIPGFAGWYEEWRERLKQDPVMRWLVEARNRIEKQGDLKTHSTARVSILAGWMGPVPVAEFVVDAMMPPDAIAEELRKVGVPPALRKEGVLVVERRWVTHDLPDRELLEVLAHCYGVLSTLLVDAHRRCGFIMRTFRRDSHETRPVRTDHLEGRLPCMVATAEMRTARIHLDSGELMEPGTRVIAIDRERAEESAKRYGADLAALAPRPGSDLLDASSRFFDFAKQALATDGNYQPIAFLVMPDGGIEPHGLVLEDRQSLYVLMERLANRIEQTGAVGIIYVAEFWAARLEEVKPGQRASDLPGRGEALGLIAATSDGKVRDHWAKFSRNEKGEIEVGPTEVSDKFEFGYAGFLEPILRVWRRGMGEKEKHPLD